VPLKYQYALDFSEGMAAVCRGVGDYLMKKWGFIDKMGNEIVPLRYQYALDFSEGMVAVERRGMWGFVSVSTPTKAE
jgi:hypothetical protein